MCHKPHWDEVLVEIEDNDKPKDNYHNSGGGLHAHEWWMFDDETGIQHLQDVVALCPECHGMKHMMLTIKQIKEGKLKEVDVISHFCEVNHCLPSTFATELERALDKYEERSNREWKVDIGGFLILTQQHFWNFVRDGKLDGKRSDEMERYLNNCGRQ